MTTYAEKLIAHIVATVDRIDEHEVFYDYPGYLRVIARDYAICATPFWERDAEMMQVELCDEDGDCLECFDYRIEFCGTDIERDCAKGVAAIREISRGELHIVGDSLDI